MGLFVFPNSLCVQSSLYLSLCFAGGATYFGLKFSSCPNGPEVAPRVKQTKNPNLSGGQLYSPKKGNKTFSSSKPKTSEWIWLTQLVSIGRWYHFDLDYSVLKLHQLELTLTKKRQTKHEIESDSYYSLWEENFQFNFHHRKLCTAFKKLVNFPLTVLNWKYSFLLDRNSDPLPFPLL